MLQDRVAFPHTFIKYYKLLQSVTKSNSSWLPLLHLHRGLEQSSSNYLKSCLACSSSNYNSKVASLSLLNTCLLQKQQHDMNLKSHFKFDIDESQRTCTHFLLQLLGEPASQQHIVVCHCTDFSNTYNKAYANAPNTPMQARPNDTTKQKCKMFQCLSNYHALVEHDSVTTLAKTKQAENILLLTI